MKSCRFTRNSLSSDSCVASDVQTEAPGGGGELWARQKHFLQETASNTELNLPSAGSVGTHMPTNFSITRPVVTTHKCHLFQYRGPI
ncbi:hypothetical protein EYF80_061887 [Liparis tanakae]|uniref:Uncharacterized protein n=1 Tax=Liparis tanakae TaxID=230148 RepID=A0A4Z2EGW5_9TELE|nr:hypothetical protein EYF80_061887 [Liparis tanakae]